MGVAAERPVTPAAEDQAIDYVLRLGRALHAYGYASPALERALVTASLRLGLVGHFFSTPTSIFVAFGTGSAQRTFLTRVEPGGISLGKLADIDGSARAVGEGTLSPAEALARIEAVERAPAPFGPALETLASGVASGAACRLLGGGAEDIVVAGGLGILIGLLGLLAGRLPVQRGLVELVSAALVSAIAYLAATAGFGATPSLSILAGLIIVIPGFSLTIAMAELAARHLVSGTARLAGAFTVFLAITFGVAVGRQIVAAAVGLPPLEPAVALPLWTLWAAILITPVAVTVLLQGPVRDLPWIILASLAGYFGGRAGTALLGPALGACLGALSVGLAAHAYERWRRRPALVALVPGVLLLVPGSSGFRSLGLLLDQQVVVGIDAAFVTLLTAASLVAGLLLAEMIAEVVADW
ncbi:MAG: threonine/serine exporter family protein [Vicinamibacteraceae bacterium]